MEFNYAADGGLYAELVQTSVQIKKVLNGVSERVTVVGVKEKRMLPEFDGASHGADVFVTGKLLDTHIGSSVRFRIDAMDTVPQSCLQVV